MESFFSSLKNEKTYHEKYSTRTQARKSVFDSTEGFYNPRRMHSTLGYLSPMLLFEKYARVALPECPQRSGYLNRHLFLSVTRTTPPKRGRVFGLASDDKPCDSILLINGY